MIIIFKRFCNINRQIYRLIQLKQTTLLPPILHKLNNNRNQELLHLGSLLVFLQHNHTLRQHSTVLLDAASARKCVDQFKELIISLQVLLQLDKMQEPWQQQLLYRSIQTIISQLDQLILQRQINSDQALKLCQLLSYKGLVSSNLIQHIKRQNDIRFSAVIQFHNAKEANPSSQKIALEQCYNKPEFQRDLCFVRLVLKGYQIDPLRYQSPAFKAFLVRLEIEQLQGQGDALVQVWLMYNKMGFNVKWEKLIANLRKSSQISLSNLRIVMDKMDLRECSSFQSYLLQHHYQNYSNSQVVDFIKDIDIYKRSVLKEFVTRVARKFITQPDHWQSMCWILLLAKQSYLQEFQIEGIRLWVVMGYKSLSIEERRDIITGHPWLQLVQTCQSAWLLK